MIDFNMLRLSRDKCLEAFLNPEKSNSSFKKSA